MLAFALFAAPAMLMAQTSTSYSSLDAVQATPQRAASQSAPLVNTQRLKASPKSVKPLSRIALSGGVSAMGVNMQAATNLNRYLNVRGTGNYFNYTVNNISTNGFNVNAKLNFATAGASLDLYPFPNHGFRLSPGALFYNQNLVSANVSVANGTKLTLGNQTYYSLPSNPITGTGSVALNTQNPAFTITTGWGNMIPRNGGHWSFPFEIGVAVVDTPAIKLSITGTGCGDPTIPATCVNMATNATAQQNLAAQITKYQNDLEPLKVYPILSFGLAYNFRIR
jgi:hypothetical protein